MKKVSLAILGIFAVGIFFTFQNCGGSEDPKPDAEAKKLLMSKTWTYSSVNTPDETATIGTDWANFSVSFGETNMTTSGHADGAEAVWPSTSYSLTTDGKTIKRGDGIDMLITTLSENNLVVRFTLTGGNHVGGRIAALDGEYTFNLQ